MGVDGGGKGADTGVVDNGCPDEMICSGSGKDGIGVRCSLSERSISKESV
jgi:hypothetical protein